MEKKPCDRGEHYACHVLACPCTCHPRPGRRQSDRPTAMTGGAATWHPGDDELWAP